MRHLLAIFIICYSPALYSQEVLPVRENVVIFVNAMKGIELNAVMNESARVVSETFDRLGRFINVEPYKRDWAFGKALLENRSDVYKRAAELLNSDIYIIIEASRSGDLIISEMSIRALSQDYKKLEGSILVKSRIGINIPYKLGVETAYLHKGIPARARVIKEKPDGTVIIDAGQWHGIRKGRYRSLSGAVVEVLSTERFTSIASVEGMREKIFILPVFPDYKKAAFESEKRIRYNTEFKYGLENTILLGGDPEKRLIEGVCVINTGANICLPGYGSFLATRYLGFQKDSPDMAGVVVSAALIVGQVTLTEFMTGFKTNFFPGVNDSGKDNKIRNLQYFLWGTLPLTFSVSYFDQLAWQYKREECLPPFFRDRDEAALVASILLPGGGLFYKGHRLAGWGYYTSEMLLAGYGAYSLGEGKKSKYAFIGLAAVKAVEMVNAYFAGTAYEFYNNEIERGRNRTGLSMGFNSGLKNERVLTMGLYYTF